MAGVWPWSLECPRVFCRGDRGTGDGDGGSGLALAVVKHNDQGSAIATAQTRVAECL